MSAYARPSRSIAVRLADATSVALKSVVMLKESHDNYGLNEPNRWEAWCCWWQGFVAGWIGDSLIPPLSQRFASLVRRVLRHGPASAETESHFRREE